MNISALLKLSFSLVFSITLFAVNGCTKNIQAIDVSKLTEEQNTLYLSAQNGNSDAQVALAKMIKSGELYPDIEKALAINWYKKALKLNNPEAFYQFANLLLKGDLLEQDVERAILYLEHASAFGSFEAASLLQVLYLSHDPSLIHDDAFRTTFSPFGNMAIQNDGNSEIYYGSSISTEDDINAIIRFANQGDGDAAERVARHYESGLATPWDSQKACKWYGKALELGFADAYGEVFNCITKELYQYERFPTGLDAIQQAAQIQHYNVDAFIGEHYYEPYLLKRDINLAIKYFERAAQEEDDVTLNLLGVIYRDGDGVKMNKEKAVEYFLRSAQQGLDVGMYHLAQMYLQGSGIEANEELAFSWMSKAAIQKNYAVAMLQYAKMHLEGIGTEPNSETAMRWFQLASQNGNGSASCYLRAQYISFSPLPFDQELAKAIWQKCS